MCHETVIFKSFKILSVLFVCALMVFRIFEQLTVVILNFEFLLVSMKLLTKSKYENSIEKKIIIKFPPVTLFICSSDFDHENAYRNPPVVLK